MANRDYDKHDEYMRECERAYAEDPPPPHLYYAQESDD